MNHATFNPDWKNSKIFPEIACWIDEVSDKHGFFCKWCKKKSTLSNMGIAAIKSHMTSKRHGNWKQLKDSNSSVTTFFDQSPKATR
jgi:hypothetical protein